MRRFLVALAALIVSSARGSPGDQLDIFNDCKYACEYQRKCLNSGINYIDPNQNVFSSHLFQKTPWPYKALFWSCIEDCDYQCQQAITAIRIEQNEEIYQFHGKWPFIRFLGLQEFYSVIFSMSNFIPHYRGYHKLRSMLEDGTYPTNFKRILSNYIYFAFCGMCAWIASSIFHCRDIEITEKGDYFFAGLTVVSAFHGLFIRITRMYNYPRLTNFFTGCMVAVFTLHLLRLYLDWSYTYNMRFNVSFGILQYGLLLFLSYQNYVGFMKTRNRHSCDISKDSMFKLCALPLILVLATSLAMSLELFDFFDYTWQIDSHALWHCATIVPTFYLYEFLINDYKSVFEREKNKA